MPSLDFSHFFEIHDAGRGLVVAAVDDTYDGLRLLRGEERPTHPIKYRPNVGSVPQDVIIASSVCVWLISERLRDLWIQNDVTGWRTFPVEATGLRNAPLPGYLGLSILGRAGPRQVERSQVAVAPPFVENRPPRRIRVGLYFDESSWDGSDIFVLEGSCHKIVTERVHDLMRAAKIKNVAFKRLTEVELVGVK